MGGRAPFSTTLYYSYTSKYILTGLVAFSLPQTAFFAQLILHCLFHTHKQRAHKSTGRTHEASAHTSPAGWEKPRRAQTIKVHAPLEQSVLLLPVASDYSSKPALLL